LGVEKYIFNIAVIEAGMAPMITSSILAMTHNLRPRLAGVMLGVGVPLSFFSLSFWYWLIGQF
jgi:predicted permease